MDFTALLTGGPLMWFAFGFLVGWGLLPQPVWAQPVIDKVKSIFGAFFKGPNPPPPTPPTSNTA